MSGGASAAYAIGAAYEATLDDSARRQGAHFTPPVIARGLVDHCFTLAPKRTLLKCCDPSCGGGVFLVACAEALVQRGASATDALASVFGVDIDPGAVMASREALCTWAAGHGVVRPNPRVRVGDGLLADEHGMDVVVGNPPFQGQLSAETTRSAPRRAELRAALGDAAGRYVDSAVLFLLAGRRMLGPGGVLCLIQPRSTAAAGDAAVARRELVEQSVMRSIWIPTRRQFNAEVDVCAPFLVAETPPPGPRPGVTSIGIHFDRRHPNDFLPNDTTQVVGAAEGADWSALLAGSEHVPLIDGWTVDGTVDDLATVTAGFRDEYYGLLGATFDSDGQPGRDGRTLRAVTCGAIDPGVCRWGHEPIRFGKRTWIAPRVDLDRLAVEAPRIATWAGALARPKVLVATQTRVIEVCVDESGDAVPITPVIAVVPHDPRDVHRVAAALSAPPVAAWMHRRRAGSGLSVGALRISASDIAAVPLPADDDSWARVARAWVRGEGPMGSANEATVAYGLDPAEFFEWWIDRWPKRTRH
jgi:hypothetical protein